MKIVYLVFVILGERLFTYKTDFINTTMLLLDISKSFGKGSFLLDFVVNIGSIQC